MGSIPDTDHVSEYPPTMDLDNYAFPDHRLKRVMDNPSKTPLLLVACGSFSPVTSLHLRIFEMAADYVKFNTDFEIIGGYLSPVSDAYRKAGLATAEHRYVTSLFITSTHLAEVHLTGPGDGLTDD